MASSGVIRGYLVEHVTGIPRWQGWKFRLVRHPASGRIVRVTATPPERHTPRRDERRARDRFLKMVKETERWFESVDADPGAAPSRSMDIDMAAFLAMLLPSPYHGHDRAEAAETVAALCRFAAAQDLGWRPLLAAIYRVSDRTVDTWMSEAHTAGLETLRRNQWRAAADEKATAEACPTARDHLSGERSPWCSRPPGRRHRPATQDNRPPTSRSPATGRTASPARRSTRSRRSRWLTPTPNSSG